MTFPNLSIWVLPLLPFIFYPAAFSTDLPQQATLTKFRTDVKSMVIVPVNINGAGPFNFIVDTGSTTSLIDPRLAQGLHLPPVGKLGLTTTDGKAVTPAVHANAVRVMGAFERSLNFLVVNRRADPWTNVRGVLGEDYLRNFDIYIDYRRQLIQLEPSPGALGNTLAGEHLSLGLYGSRGEKIASNRLVIVGQFLEFGNNNSVLEIDSGAPYLLLCSPVIRLGISNIPRIFKVTGALGGSFAATSQAAHLRLGKKELFSNVIVPKDDLPSLNVDGFLPTSLFRSIFISHSGRFVILDPSPTTALAEPQSRDLSR